MDMLYFEHTVVVAAMDLRGKIHLYVIWRTMPRRDANISDVMIFSTFTSIATLASFVQQIHYALAWSLIKQSQFETAVKSLSHPGLSFGGAAEPIDVILFYIRKHKCHYFAWCI
jgi:hypothetical protein